MYDIIIIGAGPAGLTAAIYGLRGNKKVLVLESSMVGGQIINSNDIENYPVNPHISGYEFSSNLKKQVLDLGAELSTEKVINIEEGSIKKVITNNNTYETKSIIIASGLENKSLGLDNESKLIGKGISFCATCDGGFFKNKTVAVVGGGNTAFEDALYLSNIVEKVYLIHRRDTFRADEIIVNELKNKNNIEFILNSNITSINGDNLLESIDIKNNNGESSTINIDGLFIAIGKMPNTDYLNNLLDLDESGFIVANEDCKTKIPGIFVAGDIRTKSVRQLVTATSDGAVAATEAIKYVNSL